MFPRADTLRHRLRPAVVSAVVLTWAALILSPSAAAKFGSDEPCAAPNGVTLHLVYRVPVQILTSACNRLPAGDRWSVSVPWIVNTSFERVPPGFATSWATPLDDFRGEFQAIRYVSDPGSPYELTHSFGSSTKLWVGELAEAPGLPAVNTVAVADLDPLPIGRHVVDVYWTFSAPHCDGFAANSGANCLPAGETRVKRVTFDVVAR